MVTCCRNSSNFPICRQQSKPPITQEHDPIWLKLQSEAFSNSNQEPALSIYFRNSILNHSSLESSLAHQLAAKLSIPGVLAAELLSPVFAAAFTQDADIREAIRADLRASRERDPACRSYLDCFLNYKGFSALQAYRAAHALWKQGRAPLALLIQGRASAALGVDIHPGARIGKGALLDHGTGVVIGETAVVGEGAVVLGNVTVGRAAKIGAGAVVVRDVQTEATAVGNPARVIGGKVV